jgi:hypothetical protein
MSVLIHSLGDGRPVGQILRLLDYRGPLGRFEAACTGPLPAPRFPFGGDLDLTG